MSNFNLIIPSNLGNEILNTETMYSPIQNGHQFLFLSRSQFTLLGEIYSLNNKILPVCFKRKHVIELGRKYFFIKYQHQDQTIKKQFST